MEPKSLGETVIIRAHEAPGLTPDQLQELVARSNGLLEKAERNQTCDAGPFGRKMDALAELVEAFQVAVATGEPLPEPRFVLWVSNASIRRQPAWQLTHDGWYVVPIGGTVLARSDEPAVLDRPKTGIEADLVIDALKRLILLNLD
jgi:hypothetical protein